MVISHEIAVYNDDALKKKFSSIEQTADAITLTVGKKVGYNEIISSINQTAETIQIQASKINLTGYTTFSDLPTKTSDLTNDSSYINPTTLNSRLSTAGQTTINGGNITTGTISANRLDLTGYATFSDLPTKTSDLTNDSSFATTSQIPTKTSQLTNNSGYVNGTQLATANQTVIHGGNITTGTIAGPSGTFSLNMVTGDVVMNNGTFSGDITASTGSIGGYTIDSDHLYKGTLGGSGATFWLWPAGSGTSNKATIGASGNVSGWAMTISNKFGVLNNGTVYSTTLASKGTLQVYNSYDKLEMELNQNGMDIYDADDSTSKLLGKIGVNNYEGGARYLAVDMLGSSCDGFNITRRAVGSDSGKNLFQIEKDGTTAIHGDLTVDGGLTMGGSITVPSGYTIKGDFETRNAGGFVMDQYGNFKHKSATATNTWGIQKKDGTAVFWVNYQSGDTSVEGLLTADGGISIPSGQVASGYFEAPSSNAWTTGYEGNLTHKSTSSTATLGVYSKAGSKYVKITYESGDLDATGDITSNGKNVVAVQAGETITVHSGIGGAFPATAYSSGKEVRVGIDLPREVTGRTVTVDSFSGLYFRQSDGTAIYYGTTNINSLSALPSGVTVAATVRGASRVELRFTGTNAFVTSSGGSTAITAMQAIVALFTSLVLKFS